MDDEQRTGSEPSSSTSPGGRRRSFLWAFWSLLLLAGLTGWDAVANGAAPDYLVPVLLLGSAGAVARMRIHNQALVDLPPADGTASFERRTRDKTRHERLEFVWGITALVALGLAFVVPGWLA